MPVNQNRPFERHMVSNIPNLLAAGKTLAELGIGQLGIFDAKTNKSVTAPTYATNKAIYFAQGTPDRSKFTEGAGVPNMYRKSHVIQGKSLISLRGKAASRGRGEIVTLGYDGSDATKTLTAKPGDTFYYWIRLTGEPIFNLNPDRAKGVIVQGAVSMPCASDCADNCTTVDCNTIADLVLNDLIGVPDQNDPLKIKGGKFLPGGQRVTDYVHFSKVSTCNTPTAYECFKQVTLSVVDNGTQSDLGQVQAQYPGLAISVLSRTGVVTTYAALVLSGDSVPKEFFQEAGILVTNCGTCPVGATYVASTDQFQLTVTNNGPDDHSGDIQTVLAGSYLDVTVALNQIDPLTGTSTYQINLLTGTATAAILQALLQAAFGKHVVVAVVLVGTVAAGCLLEGSKYTWTASSCDAVCTYLGNYTLTLKDKVCGTCESSSSDSDVTYYSEIEALYVASGFASSLTVSAASGVNCTRQYVLTVISNPGNVGCTTDQVVFPIVPDFNEQKWLFNGVIGITPGTCACGIQGASDFTPRLENECTFGYFTRQYDWVHIEFSSHNPDWRSTDLCEQDPIATRIQNGAYPNGDGSAVVRIEKADRMYDMDYWYLAPNLREAFDFYFEARFDTYYDMVAVEFEYSYSSNAFFGQTDHDRYIQFFWLPEGQTGQLTTALNTYAASANINIDPVVV